MSTYFEPSEAAVDILATNIWMQDI